MFSSPERRKFTPPDLELMLNVVGHHILIREYGPSCLDIFIFKHHVLCIWK